MYNVLASFMRQASVHPDRVAISYGDRNISYRELNHKSNALAKLLQQAGVKSEDIIPLVTKRSPEFVIGILAILKTGAGYIPVDIHLPKKRIVNITGQSGSHVVLISHAAFSSVLDTSGSIIIAIDRETEDNSVLAEPIPTPLGDIAYVIFTSGTTGIPKGVMVSHASLNNLISWHNSRFEMTSDSRSSLIAGIGFDVAQWEIWSPLTCGATLVLPDNEEIRLQPDLLQRFFVRSGMTHAFIPTVLVVDFVSLPQPDDLVLRYLFTAGEKLNSVTLRQIRYALVDYYGPTEATIFTTCNLVECATRNPVNSIGIPIAGAEVFILDENRLPVADGQPGELYIAGPGLAVGYLNKPELTNEKFMFLPDAPEKRVYRSGDRARMLPDGRIQFLGRLDDQIKIRGYRIELGEIESALMQIQGVTAAVALVNEDMPSGDKSIVAFIAADHMNLLTIRTELAEMLPVYCMPAAIQILQRLPMTQNGKTDKQALLAGYRAELSHTANTVFHGLEDILAEIWKKLLGSEVRTPDDNFFDLGGHSLLAAKLAAAITAQTSIRVYVRDIYESPTIRLLACTLDERRGELPPSDDSEPLRILQDDIFLPDDIQFSAHFDQRQITNPRTIFLTGATGFVGSQLLADLLQGTDSIIYCLVRSKTNAQASARVKDSLKRFAITLSQEQLKRIYVLSGDLAAPRFALDQEVYQRICLETDIIYHSASAVNFIQPYSWMKRDNVQGLREIIRFAAARRTKPLMLLSTISVYSWGHLHTGKQIMREDDDIDQNLPAVITDIGYVRSKWVMEKITDLAASRGLPVMTFRLGYATCNSKTGISADYQWWGRLVKTCIQTKSVPVLRNLREGLTTVDYMTQAITAITRNPKALGQKFNLIHEQKNNLTLEEFFQLLEDCFGFRFTRMPYTEWLAQWEHDENAPLYPLLSLFKDKIRGGRSTVELYQDTYRWDCSNVKLFLQGTGVKEFVFNRDLLVRYLQHSIGYEVGE
ncbi:amino acid adenylation domain-containing protein [Enterobacter ludwigii]